jgi:nicotinamidase-related amidase
MMKSAVVVIDMVKDSLELSHNPRYAQRAKDIVPAINRLTAGARERDWPVVFSTDSFMPGDSLFRGRMPEHSLRGTEGAEVTSLLEFLPEDHWLPKRRMSAFFKTDLDLSLRLWKVERVLVCGVMTPYCVLTSALDSVCHDFYTVIVEDASNAPYDEQHNNCLDLYRKSPLRPVLTVQTVDQILSGFEPEA